jgi:hypothetical protein
MSQQPESIPPLFATSPAPVPEPVFRPRPESGPASPPPSHPGKHGPQRIPRWLERSELFLRVLLRMYIGLAICYAPWSGQVLTFLPWSHGLWDHNPLFVQYPILGVYAAKGAVRGIVSGLGLLNLWIALQDALRHRDR